ncbi:MAG: hypothetical protein HY748_11640 [Elusimicrobia bacterium]|nr:hypothetical protein [Elusimicrobiota bacterium]
MKLLGNILAGAGIVVAVYSVIGRFAGGPTIGLGMIAASAQSGLVFANLLLLASLVVARWEK